MTDRDVELQKLLIQENPALAESPMEVSTVDADTSVSNLELETGMNFLLETGMFLLLE